MSHSTTLIIKIIKSFLISSWILKQTQWLLLFGEAHTPPQVKIYNFFKHFLQNCSFPINFKKLEKYTLDDELQLFHNCHCELFTSYNTTVNLVVYSSFYPPNISKFVNINFVVTFLQDQEQTFFGPMLNNSELNVSNTELNVSIENVHH